MATILRPLDEAIAREDARHCEAVTRAHARTFTLASTFLPAPKRRAAFAVYAFCRQADDLVDLATTRDPSLLRGDLDRLRAGVRAALDGRPDGAVMRELHRAVERFAIPASAIIELLDGIARDLAPARYDTWPELERYCEGVASTVGVMCTHVFGVPGGPEAEARALAHARTLGVAMQLTNILRDVGEDAGRGRCYLPAAELARFGLDAGRVLNDAALRNDPRWVEFMRFEVARARSLYRAAAPGIALLASDSQRCARACAEGYAAILGAIEANRYDVFSTRARPSAMARAGVFWNCWCASGSKLVSA